MFHSGIAVVQALGYKPEVAGSRPEKVIEFYQFTSSSRPHKVLRFTQPLTGTAARSRTLLFVGSRAWPVYEAELAAICEATAYTMWKQHLTTLPAPRPVTGIASLITFMYVIGWMTLKFIF
jgi:hypothetical protein